ncbi:FAD-dependent oxidoreductase [Streptomyces mirabilis]|nr:FAD-dependent oxidoreductase [Streptomyces mirabilis]
MTAQDRVLVVGASAAGLSTVEALRRKGYEGGITVLGAEPHAPYDRPPLSKQVLSGAWEPGRSALRTQEALSTLDAEFVLGDAAVALDTGTRTVRARSGRELRADAIVIATGVRPRVLPGQEGLTGVHVLRTLDDALALRKDLLDSARLVVVGEGVLGAEIAATARTLGLDVTGVARRRWPCRWARWCRAAGGTARRGAGCACGSAPVSQGLAGARAGHRSASGRARSCRPIPWWSRSATPRRVAGGQRTAPRQQGGLRFPVPRGGGVYAVGDAAGGHRATRRLVRLENRTNATEQAAAVAGVILGEDRPYQPVPYFWTDQFDAKLQVHGLLPADAEVDVVEGDVTARRFVARYRSDGVVTGVLGWNMPKQARLRRQEIVDALNAPTPTH